MPELNELVGGRYQIQGPLGEGGSGSVLQAWDTRLGRMVALKRIKENPVIEASIQHEASLLAALDHPNVVTVFDFGEDEGAHFVIMELLNGRTLEEMVQEQPLTLPKFLLLMNQICRGLAAAHAAGLIHCDLKPANIMLLSHRDGSVTAKVLDFGLATAIINTTVFDSSVENSQTIQGTPQIISPEQLMGYPADVRSDIYSLGCTFYYALSGAYPHDAQDVSAIVERHLHHTPKLLHRIRSDIPEPLSLAIAKMLARDPNARPQDAETVRVSLEGAARAPSAQRRETRQIHDYSTRPARAMSSTILTPPALPHLPSHIPSVQVCPQTESACQASASIPASNRRIQMIISCVTLVLIAVGAAAFWYYTKTTMKSEQVFPNPATKGEPSIMDMIKTTPPPRTIPG